MARRRRPDSATRRGRSDSCECASSSNGQPVLQVTWGESEDHRGRELPGADVVVASVDCGDFAVAFVSEGVDASPDLAEVALALTSFVLEEAELGIAIDRFGFAEGFAEG